MNQVEIKFNDQKIIGFWRDEADESVWAEIFKWSEYRRAEDVIKNSVYPILDVGAHVGFFALYARALNPKAMIFCIEPEPKNVEWLERHLEVNKIEDIKIIAGALSDSTNTALLLFSADSHNHKLAKSDDATSSTITVKTFSLEGIYKKNKIERFGLIKMDIEGGEYAVLRSWQKEDWDKIENLILEYHDSDQENHSELESIMRANGFSVQKFPSQFDKTMGFFFAHNKRIK